MKSVALAVVFEIASRIALAQGGDGWIVSETTSPVNYSPIVTATAYSRPGSGASMQLSIYCRGGRTELVLAGPATPGNGSDHLLSYSVNDGQAVPAAIGPSAFGAGSAFRGDVPKLLRSLPDEGELVVRVAGRNGASQDGRFPLAGLKAAKARVAAACNWPPDVAQPRADGSSKRGETP